MDKLCLSCNETKDLFDFCKHKGRHDGLAAYCKECEKIRLKKYYAKNRKSRILAAKVWSEKNPEERKEIGNRYQCERRKDPKYRLTQSVSSAINRCIRKNGFSSFTLLPYSFDELVGHLEGKFQQGMTWDNYGEWHIDHIKPVILFEYNSHKDPQFIQCWSLSNLQPLWKFDNLSKGGRYVD